MNRSSYPPSVLLPVKRIVAIGDLHGDYKATLLALRKSKLIDSKNLWIGDKTVVIQMGDQVDRGGRGENVPDEDSEMKIMNLFDKLHIQAKKVGGAVYSLLGNHELMNVLGDFSYTSAMGIKHFGGEDERLKQFRPGGKIAQKMSKNRNVIIRVGDWIFVHGGLTPRLAKKYKISEINALMRAYLMGHKELEDNKCFKELFLNNGSLLWTRRYSEENPDCKSLDLTLKYLGAKKMVVAHTPQDKINCKCRGAIWRIDVAMSQAFGKRHGIERIEVLEILDDGKTINII
jgi:hypothetical protein